MRKEKQSFGVRDDRNCRAANVARILGAVLLVGAIGFITFLLPAQAGASTVTVLNFDSLSLANGACATGAATEAYLGGFGITFSSPTAGAIPQICNGVGTEITAVSGSNWLIATPPITNTNLSWTLTFSTPVDSVSWNDAVLSTIITYPTWNATAFDGSTPLGTVGQTSAFGSGATQAFTINGPGITSLTFNAFNSTARSTNDVPIDNLTLATPSSATPEPAGSGILFAIGSVALICLGRKAVA